MKKSFAILVAAAALTIGSAAACAQMMRENPMVGGAAMYPTKTIVANAVNSADHTTLVAAVKAAAWSKRLTAKVRSRSSLQPTTPSLNCLPERLTRYSSRKTRRC